MTISIQNSKEHMRTNLLGKLLRIIFLLFGGRRGRDGMVVGFITTYAVSAYHH